MWWQHRNARVCVPPGEPHERYMFNRNILRVHPKWTQNTYCLSNYVWRLALAQIMNTSSQHSLQQHIDHNIYQCISKSYNLFALSYSLLYFCNTKSHTLVENVTQWGAITLCHAILFEYLYRNGGERREQCEYHIYNDAFYRVSNGFSMLGKCNFEIDSKFIFREFAPSDR